MKYAVNEEGIAALRRMATEIVAAEEVIYDAIGSLKDNTDSYDGVLGPHKKSLEGVIENVQTSVHGATGTIKEISELLEEIAEGYREIMNDNVFSGIGGATGSVASGLNSFLGGGNGSEASSGEKSDGKPIQLHHFATNKNKKYTSQFENITKKYGLDLDDEWNKELIPHQGKHSYDYHDYTLDNMQKFDRIAKGDKAKFLKLFEQMKQKIRNNPEMLYKDYWKKR